MDWIQNPPPSSELADRDIKQTGTHLAGQRIALLITGSIAAYRTPDLIRDLRREGAEVFVYASREALSYVTKQTLEWTSLHPVCDSFTGEAEHLSESHPFDAYLVAPASYNTINKAALGIADSVVTTTLASALGRQEMEQAVVLFAPAMHGTLHNRILSESLARLQALGATLIPPRQEQGKNHLAPLETLVAATIRALSGQPLCGKKIIVTGGPTPVPIDHVRRITTVFTGGLGIELTCEAWLRGASSELVLGKGSAIAPEYFPTHNISTYNDYVRVLQERLDAGGMDWGIFTAAVADYQPKTVYDGKLPSGQNLSLPLVATQKVVRMIRERYPKLGMVAFKYEEGHSHEHFMDTAKNFLAQGGFQLVVANRGEECSEAGQHIAWLISPDAQPTRHLGKPAIAAALLDWIAARS